MTSTRDPNSIDWSDDHYAKRSTDVDMIHDIMSHPFFNNIIKRGVSHIATLSADSLIFEKMFAQKVKKLNTNFAFYPIERDKEVYKKLLTNNIPNLSYRSLLKVKLKDNPKCSVIFTYKPMSVIQYFDLFSMDIFDFIYLDYMGTWSTEKEKDLNTIFQHGYLMDNSFLAITIAGARGNAITKQKLIRAAAQVKSKVPETKIIGDPEVYFAKTTGVIASIEQIAEKYSYTARLIKFYVYPSSTFNKNGEKTNRPEYKFLFSIEKKL